MAAQSSEGPASLDTATRLALDRTRLAYERTMMAWVRTAASMITFGFSIYKFFQIEATDGARGDRLFGPSEFALLMIAIGLASLLLATVEHRQNMRILRAQDPAMPGSLSTVIAALISVLGIVALIAVIFRQ
jgi:putative membrane protein